MKGKKAALGEALGLTGLAAMRLRAMAPPRDQLLVLAYHRVLDIGQENAFTQDPELVSASVADFERQMQFVREYFTVLPLSRVLDCIYHGTALPRRSLVITFDDGHLDNYTNAFPVLRRLGLPATIFLSTDYIGSQDMFWFDRVAQLLYFAPQGHWRFAGVDFHLPPPGNVDARRQAAGTLLHRLKQMPNGQRLSCLQDLENALAGSVPASCQPPRSALNWSEVREMAAANIEFGSHTCSHPILSRLEDDELKHELQHSRQVIAAESCPTDIIAYPVGKAGAFDARVIDVSRRLGYRLGVSYETGLNRLSRLQPFALRRLAVERYTSMPFFKAMLAFPALLA